MRYSRLCQSITLAAVIVFLAASNAHGGQDNKARYFIQGYDNTSAVRLHGTLELKSGYDFTTIWLDGNGKPTKPFAYMAGLHQRLVGAINNGEFKGVEILYIGRYEIQLTKNSNTGWSETLNSLIKILQSVADEEGKILEYKIPEELVRQSMACNLMHLPSWKELPKRQQPSVTVTFL